MFLLASFPICSLRGLTDSIAQDFQPALTTIFNESLGAKDPPPAEIAKQHHWHMHFSEYGRYMAGYVIMVC